MIDGLADCPACGGTYTVQIGAHYVEGVPCAGVCDSCKKVFKVTVILKEVQE